MNYSQSAFEKSNYQLNNLWEFSITQHKENDWPLVTYVKDTNLSFINLTTETRNTGEKHYNGFTPVESFTMTFRENTEFDSYKYFKEWFDQVFDEVNGTFLSLNAGIKKGDPEDVIHRTGLLTFNSFEIDQETREDWIVKEIRKALNEPSISYQEVRKAVVQTIKKQEVSAPKIPTVIVNKEILGNIFTALGRQAVNTAASTVNRVANIGRKLTGQATKASYTLPPPPTRKRYSIIRSPIGYNLNFETIRERPSIQKRVINLDRLTEQINEKAVSYTRYTLKEKQTKAFRYEGLKILGLSSLDLSYEDGGPLEYVVNFTVDRIIAL